MFARFDENPAMTLRVIKETKRYGRTDGRTDARTDNVKTVYPLQTKFAGGIKIISGFPGVLAHTNPFLIGKKNKRLPARFELTFYLLYVTSHAPNPLHYSGRYCLL